MRKKDTAIYVNGPVGNKGGVHTFNLYLIEDLLKHTDFDIFLNSRYTFDNPRINKLSAMKISSIADRYKNIYFISSLYNGLLHIPGKLVINKSNIKYIQVLHGFRPFITRWNISGLISDPIKALLSSTSILFASKFADIVIANSYLTSSFYMRMFNIESKVAPLFFDSFFERIPIKSKNSLLYDISFAGRLVPLKGIKLLLEAVRILEEKYNRKLKICIMGQGPEKKEVLRYKDMLKSDFYSPGHISVDEVIHNIQLSRIFVVPTYMESFGLAIAEGLSTGTITVTTKYSGINDFLNISFLHRVLPEPEYIADSINRLLEKYPDYDKERNKREFISSIKDKLFVYHLLRYIDTNENDKN